MLTEGGYELQSIMNQNLICIICKSSVLVNWATARIWYFKRKLSLFSRPNITTISYYCNDNNNTIQLNSLLFVCRVNSYKANYRHSTL
jgi:hypothetical protein